MTYDSCQRIIIYWTVFNMWSMLISYSLMNFIYIYIYIYYTQTIHTHQLKHKEMKRHFRFLVLSEKLHWKLSSVLNVCKSLLIYN